MLGHQSRVPNTVANASTNTATNASTNTSIDNCSDFFNIFWIDVADSDRANDFTIVVDHYSRHTNNSRHWTNERIEECVHKSHKCNQCATNG